MNLTISYVRLGDGTEIVLRGVTKEVEGTITQAGEKAGGHEVLCFATGEVASLTGEVDLWALFLAKAVDTEVHVRACSKYAVCLGESVDLWGPGGFPTDSGAEQTLGQYFFEEAETAPSNPE